MWLTTCTLYTNKVLTDYNNYICISKLIILLYYISREIFGLLCPTKAIKIKNSEVQTTGKKYNSYFISVCTNVYIVVYLHYHNNYIGNDVIFVNIRHDCTITRTYLRISGLNNKTALGYNLACSGLHIRGLSL